MSEINGCVSTGKEANVYHGMKKATGDEFAVKIFKTSILIFKDRDRYVSGEFRFRNGYGKSNPRKMVATWAEKELRNLKRINVAEIPSPKPVLNKANILVMTFLGHDGAAAPRLKDCRFEDPEPIYRQTIGIMRTLYQECRLVHADFSEYNLLYHDGLVHVIDVGQAVEHDHPSSLQFLKRDCFNINDYFRRIGTDTMGLNAMFEFITDITPGNDNERWLTAMSKDQEDEGDFQDMWVPRTLNDVDIHEVLPNHVAKLTGATVDQDEEDSAGESNPDTDEETNPESVEPKLRGDVLYAGMTKAERKAKVKEDKKAKRKDKIPKHVKKAAAKKNRR